MDIHKQFTVAVVKDERGNKLAQEKFNNTKENFSNFLEVYKHNETKIVMESTCVWEYIYEILEAMNYCVKLANPVRTRAIAEARKKTDIVDAETLADLLRADLISESYIPPKAIRLLREIARERKTFIKQTTQIKNRIHAILIKRGIKIPTTTLCKGTLLWIRSNTISENILKNYLDLLDYYELKLDEINSRIKAIAEKNTDAELLMTIPGIAEIRAVDIVSEIGEIKRFPTADRLCSYTGLVPSIHQSGDTLHFGRLVKQSSKALKWALIEVSWNIVRTKKNNPLQEFYKKLAKKKGKSKAICATARKLCCVIHAMLTNREEFRYS